MQTPLKTIFYIEAAINIAAGILSLLLPARFLNLFGPAEGSAIELALIQVVGGLLIAVSVILIQALRVGSIEAIRPVIQGYLVGDVLFLYGLFTLAQAAGTWTIMSIVIAVLTVVLALVRIYALWFRLDLLAHLHPAAGKSGKR
jgi:hypothetical protein